MTGEELHIKRNQISEKCYKAIREYRFHPNNNETWENVVNACEIILGKLWLQGELMGPNQCDAYDVKCGLGSTMTGSDILESTLNVIIKVRLSTLPEFEVITIQLNLIDKNFA